MSRCGRYIERKSLPWDYAWSKRKNGTFPHKGNEGKEKNKLSPGFHGGVSWHGCRRSKRINSLQVRARLRQGVRPENFCKNFARFSCRPKFLC
jgi:hypothetical protein